MELQEGICCAASVGEYERHGIRAIRCDRRATVNRLVNPVVSCATPPPTFK
jgi:hypothetical protein